MTEATEKQINFAKTLGITEPEQYSKETLRELIDKKVVKAEPQVKETQKTAQNGSQKPYNGAAMYVSYGKDLIIAGKTLKEAITIVESLKEAFE